MSWRSRLFLTVAEAAELLRVDPRTLRRALEAGEIRGVRVSTQWRVPVAEMVRLVDGDDTPNTALSVDT